MKALLINGSPHEKGCTYTALRELANTPEEVRQDKEGMQTMRTLGRNMAFLMKSIQLGKAQFGLPEKEPVTQTNFHH